MKLRYIKYLGFAAMAGMIAGIIGTAMLCTSRGLRGTKRSAKKAMHAMGEVTGAIVREDITNRIFERFCVGK